MLWSATTLPNLSPALIEGSKLNIALIRWFDFIPAQPEYKSIIFYGQGFKTAKGYCTIMSFLGFCNPLPYFSNPNLSYEGEKLGEVFGYENYNAKWIRANRFLLKEVGTEEQNCEFTKGSLDWQENMDTKSWLNIPRFRLPSIAKFPVIK